jgi:hypothetical protein
VERWLALIRQLNMLLVRLGGERVSAKKLRAQAPDLWREVDAIAPGMIDLFMAAVAGGPAALGRLERIVRCPTMEQIRTLQ